MEGAMGLMRRMPPKHTQTALSALLSLLPDHSSGSPLLIIVSAPLQVLCDEDSGKEFILCEYNRDADSYRYYEGGISSVYLWEEDDNEGFVACFLIKKDGSNYAHGKRGYLHEGGWEAIHVIQMKADLSVEDGHLCNMGKMIEELEGKLRNQLDQVYFGKTKEMVCTLRPPSDLLSMTLPDSRNP
ncbi:probable F-actin-capping protein subunit beta [Tanacetum coccineum]